MKNNLKINITGKAIGKEILLILISILLFIGLVAPSFSADFSRETRDRILNEYYPPQLVKQMLCDVEDIVKEFDEFNIFSSAQYGDKFMLGVVDIGDVFDAGRPGNMKIFREYARDNLLIQNVDEAEHYNKYARGANRFMKELGYDAVIFRPDEYHPVFTNPNDPWMFIREEPAGKKDGDYYYSGRVRERKNIVEGGIPLEPKKTYGCIQYYIPVAGSKYKPYRMINERADKDFTPLSNKYKKTKITDEMRKKRKKLGIIPSPLSGRKNLRVGCWGESGKKGDMALKHGIPFRATGKEYTWGDVGIYVIPLDKYLWD
ncbi:MAG: hypothetical protein K8T10_14795 [Candidatus Eremiobacteraeota bacterium]|nr:hypothetical protein [Candidatus Eremiobacteraeota bacterium]